LHFFQRKSKKRVLGSILTTFNAKLLQAQIAKAQKNKVKLSIFFALLGSALVKAAHKMLVKSTLSWLLAFRELSHFHYITAPFP
jgi:hypothetical protein